MEPLYRSLVERAKKHKTFHDFVRDELTTHYLNARLEHFGRDEHYQQVEKQRNGLFDVNPSLFLKLHNEHIGPRFGIPSEPERRRGMPLELQTLRINPKYADELAREVAGALVVAEKNFWKVPFWKAPKQDVISIMKNKMLEVHERYKRRGEHVLIGPSNIV